MEWIVNNWGFLLILLMAIVGLVKLALGQTESAKFWLLKAVMDAEREFGSKTGRIKLLNAYEWFMTHYPFLRSFVSVELFDSWVKTALEEMERLAKSNAKIDAYIHGEPLDFLPEDDQNGGE